MGDNRNYPEEQTQKKVCVNISDVRTKKLPRCPEAQNTKNHYFFATVQKKFSTLHGKVYCANSFFPL